MQMLFPESMENAGGLCNGCVLQPEQDPLRIQFTFTGDSCVVFPATDLPEFCDKSFSRDGSKADVNSILFVLGIGFEQQELFLWMNQDIAERLVSDSSQRIRTE